MSTLHHIGHAVRFSPRQIKRDIAAVEGFNAKLAVIITQGVGTMACAYLFATTALLSLPATLIAANVVPASTFPRLLTSPGLILVIAWVAQTFLQLVLLSIILVGQRVQSAASDARSEQEFTNTVAILDRLDVKTEGGLKAVLDAVSRRP